MYASFFGLNEKPFSITPDPRYLFLSERHAEALAHLVYGINEAGGFIQLTGEVGTGKTTVVRSLLAQAPKHAEIALILNPRMTPAEFLLAICEELRHHRAGRVGRQPQGSGRPAEPPPAQRPRRGQAHRAGGRRGAEPQRRSARAGPPADQPRDRNAEAAADHPHRSAGAARVVRPHRAAPARATHHRPVPPRSAVGRGGRRVRPPSPARRRLHARDLQQRRAARDPASLGRRAATHQHHQRSRACWAPFRKTVTPSAPVWCAAPPEKSSAARSSRAGFPGRWGRRAAAVAVVGAVLLAASRLEARGRRADDGQRRARARAARRRQAGGAHARSIAGAVPRRDRPGQRLQQAVRALGHCATWRAASIPAARRSSRAWNA